MDPTVKNPADNGSNAMTAYRGVEPERAAIMAKNIMTGDVVTVDPHTSAQDGVLGVNATTIASGVRSAR